MRISLITLGDPARLTGGYLYHRRLAAAAPSFDCEIAFVTFPDLPFPFPFVAGPAVMRASSEGDVVVLDSIAAAFAAPWMRLARAPLVAMLHQPPGGIDHGPARAALQRALDRIAYRRAVKLVVASDALACEVGMLFPGADIVVVPPGRDVAVPQGDAGDLRGGKGAALLCVGNWQARKGILELLDACARLDDADAMLHLAGDDRADKSYAARVRTRLEAADLQGRVVVHGPVSKERVAELYAAADVFVLASVREPYGTAYGEAMAAGLPVVGWRAGNLPYLAAHEREGLIVERGDVDGLARALARLARDDALRARLAEAARRRAASLPTWEETAAMFFAAVRGAASSR